MTLVVLYRNMEGNASVRLIIVICLSIVAVSYVTRENSGFFDVVWCGVEAKNYAHHNVLSI